MQLLAGILAGQQLVCLLVLGHGVADDILRKCDAGAAPVESDRVEVVAEILLIKTIQLSSRRKT